MVTSRQCLEKWGDPSTRFDEGSYMVLWEVPQYVWQSIPTIPRRIYCNKQMRLPLELAFLAVIERGLSKEIKTWDGCFNIRRMRGYKSWSLHSWGIAIDINAAWNGLGEEPQMKKELVECFIDASFEWGGTWKRKDGMHFQLAYLV